MTDLVELPRWAVWALVGLDLGWTVAAIGVWLLWRRDRSSSMTAAAAERDAIPKEGP